LPFEGTRAQYIDFWGLGKQFSEQLSAYINERINLKRTNFILTYITVFIPHVLVAIVGVVLMLNLIPRDSVMMLFQLLALYLIFEVCAVVYVLRKVNRIEKAGIAFLRKTEEEHVRALRDLARLEFPQEKGE
jgi:hypothetical protein